MAGSRWRNWSEAGILEASELKHSSLLDEVHHPVSPMAGRGKGRVHAQDIRLPKAALSGCSILGDKEIEGTSPSESTWGSHEPRSVATNCSSLSERVSDKNLIASGRARSVLSRICRQPGGLARLPHERQEQVAAAASVGTGFKQSYASTSMGTVGCTSLDEAKDTATGTKDVKRPATSTEDIIGTATGTKDVKRPATSTEDFIGTATGTEDIIGTATSTEDIMDTTTSTDEAKGIATSTEDVKGPGTSTDKAEAIASSMDDQVEQKWEVDGCTIYLNNLPPNLTHTELAALLEGYGTVRNLALQPSTDHNCISAHVCMDSSSACEWIVSCLNGTSLDSSLNTTIECGFLQSH